MGNVLTLHLQSSFNMQDPVLKWAIWQAQAKPSDYVGYHLSHYLLYHALSQTSQFCEIPNYKTKYKSDKLITSNTSTITSKTTTSTPFSKKKSQGWCGYCAQYGHKSESCLFMAKLVASLQNFGFKIRNKDAKTLASCNNLSNKQSCTKAVNAAIADMEALVQHDEDFIDSLPNMPLQTMTDFC